MNETILETKKRELDNNHCGACGAAAELPGDLGWMTLRHPSGQIKQFEQLCGDCCVRLADFFELLQCKK